MIKMNVDDGNDERFETVYKPTTQLVIDKNNAVDGNKSFKMIKMESSPISTAPNDATISTIKKPASYNFSSMIPSNTTAPASAQSSTPSDSRSICDTPDLDPWHIPELQSSGPAWKGKFCWLPLILLNVYFLWLIK